MSRAKARKAAVPVQPEIPQWVKEMHDHYQKKGFYRSEDVERVLGDPGKRVEAPASMEISKFRRA